MASASIVVMTFEPTVPTRVAQDRAPALSSSTVQAPHCPSPAVAGRREPEVVAEDGEETVARLGVHFPISSIDAKNITSHTRDCSKTGGARREAGGARRAWEAGS